MGYLFGDERGGITFGDEGLCEVGNLVVEVIRGAADMLSQMRKEKAMECLVVEGSQLY